MQISLYSSKKIKNILKNIQMKLIGPPKDDKESCVHTCNNIITAIKNKIDKHIQLKHRKSNKNRLPWFNEYLWDTMKQRDKALKVSLKTKLTTDYYIYKSLRNKVAMLLRKANAIFFLNLIKEAKGNLWRSMDK